MHPVSFTKTCYDVTDLVNHGIVENTKTWIAWELNLTFLRNKKILNLCLRWHISRSYHFVAEETFDNKYRHQNDVIAVVMEPLLFTLNRCLYFLFLYFHRWIWTSKYRLGWLTIFIVGLVSYMIIYSRNSALYFNETNAQWRRCIFVKNNKIRIYNIWLIILVNPTLQKNN